MAGRRGRPEQVTDGRWRHSEILNRRVVTIVCRRDPSDPETITEVTTLLLALAGRVLGPRVLDDEQEKRLRDLAVHAKPSEVTRTMRVYTRTTVRSVTRHALVCAQVRVDGFALDEGGIPRGSQVRRRTDPRSAGRDRRIGRHLVAADAAAQARRRPRGGRSQENRPRHHRLARQLMVPRYTSS